MVHKSGHRSGQRASKTDLAGLHAACEANYLRLMRLFPDSCAVWMYRHYDDCVNSILTRWPGHRNGIDEIVPRHFEAEGRAAGLPKARALELLRDMTTVQKSSEI